MQSYWKHFFLDNGDIQLIEAGTQKYLPDQTNDYTVKHDYVFHLVLSGKGTYQVNEMTYQLQAHDSFILKKNKAVHYYPDPNDPWTICWIGLGGANIDKYIEETALYQSDIFHFSPNSYTYNYMINFVKELRTTALHSMQDICHTLSKIYTLLALINEELGIDSDIIDPLSQAELTFAEQIYNYIATNFQESLSIEEIAHHFDISRNYLFKICKQYYDQSPKQIIQELRLNHAAQLLRGSRMKVNEISDAIGYKDAFQFSKMFKNYYGHSPSQFRFLSDEAIDEALFIRNRFLQ